MALGLYRLSVSSEEPVREIPKPTMIADITTSIHDSDGKYANVDKTSAVIYKIQKVRRTPTGIIDDIMALEKQEVKKNKK